MILYDGQEKKHAWEGILLLDDVKAVPIVYSHYDKTEAYSLCSGASALEELHTMTGKCSTLLALMAMASLVFATPGAALAASQPAGAPGHSAPAKKDLKKPAHDAKQKPAPGAKDHMSQPGHPKAPAGKPGDTNLKKPAPKAHKPAPAKPGHPGNVKPPKDMKKAPKPAPKPGKPDMKPGMQKPAPKKAPAPAAHKPASKPAPKSAPAAPHKAQHPGAK